MSEFYLSLEQTAKGLIDQFGQSAKLFKRTQHAPEPWNPVITEQEFEVKLVQTTKSQSYRNETTIQANDVFFYRCYWHDSRCWRWDRDRPPLYGD